MSSAGKELSAGELSSKAPSLLAGLPLYFEPNQGQGTLDPADSRARFISRGAGYSLFLGADGAILSLASHQPQKGGSAAAKTPSAPSLEFLQMKLAGANPQTSVSATNLLPGKSSYFIGNDASKWRTAVPHFARVRYENVYPGINLVFYGSEGQLEYDFQVAPGSDPAQAELEFNGARKLELKDGALVIHAVHGSVALQAPRVYQEIAGKQQPVEASFVLRGDKRAGFAIAPYDHSRELVIDPVLNFATYFGGTGDELNNFVAVDGNLNIYLAGSTMSASLPGIGPGSLQQTLKGAQNVYIAKMSPPLGGVAAALQDVTYLGGSATDTPVGIQVDGGDNPYLAGTTSSTDFPTTGTNAYQATIYAGSTGTTHVFVTRIKSDFTALQYSSYLSGNGTDTASGMAIDATGNLYVTGTTTSNDVASSAVQFPASTVPNGQAFQQNSFAPIQFFVTKVNTTRTGITSVAYSTYFGGAAPSGGTAAIATGGGITVDTNQNVYFTGTTNFTYSGTAIGAGDFPIQNAYQPCLNSPPAAVILPPQTCGTPPDPTLPDAFAAKLSTTTVSPAQQLVWSTYLGGTGTDSGAGIALDTGAANVYVVGTTNSPDFVNSAFVSTFASFQRCLNNLFITATTCTAQKAPPTPPNDAFVARISNPTITQGSTTTVALNYFSYLGGSGTESGNAITVDSNSGAVITGSTTSPFTSTTTAGTFPLTPNPSSIQSQLTEAQAAFVARVNTAAVTGQTTTASWATYFGGNCNTLSVPPCTPPDPFISSGTGIALDVNQNTYVSGDTNSPYLIVSKPLAQNTTLAGGHDAFVTQFGLAYSLSISGVLGLGTNQSLIAAGNPATFTYTITNQGPDLASNVTIVADMSQAAAGVPLTNITGSISTGTCGAGSTSTGISCGPISLQAGSTATLTITATPTSVNATSLVAFNGGTITAISPANIVLAQTSVSAEMSDFRMTASPLNQSVPQAGATATYSVSLTPQPLFGSAITLSCTGTPANSSCAFSPGSSVTLQSSSGSTVTLNIPTTARPITPAASLFNRQFYALWLAIPCIAILGIGGNRRRRKIVGISMLCMIFALLLLLPACSHSTTQTPSSGTPAGSYPITITASSGTNSKSQTVTLNVP